MTTHRQDFDLNRPAALIAAIPAILGFVPEKSLVLVSAADGALDAVLRADLCEHLTDRIGELAGVAAAAEPDAVIAVVVDEDGAHCAECNRDYRRLCEALARALLPYGIDFPAGFIVDNVARGGRWHCVDGCGAGGIVEDPSASPLAAAAVLDGRRLYSRRADLQAVIAADPERTAALGPVLEQASVARERAHRTDPLGCCRDDVRNAIEAASRVADGQSLSDADVARLGTALRDARVRDILYGLAVAENAAAAETLWSVLARGLPQPWRAEALAMLAFSAYVRGDGPLAGISLETALQCDPDHRMAGMLDTALRSGMRPDDIRELAATGYRLADRLGLRLPPPRDFGRQAG
ncbi:DUF4192 domain-containing protein [Mycobacterium sp.]|uniref:DUF4192 domain-containing protein n=1 Tax=Mycobacterium sp. TaxID=1785 RepID=UPI003A8A79BF